ncbi:flagellar hook-basal body complex protein FliE [Opitutus sp. ER46]|uniref:flagellar hook-basal body complex protein FliE n=1 Tax=Opitutus sp. ER46 TaxID=2161864 RepID=UPI000D30CD79|nr:flagellar hook-basal body complex protein FliE [Opitutus sp. ER46]PTX90895.1 flagellar hook-basal body complex protein FliE [Opitutus sp. ER46]
MSLIGSINPLSASPLTRIETTQPKIAVGLSGAGKTAPTESFGQVLDEVVSTVQTKQDAAQDITRKVLLGETDQLHQGMIAMQEASVAFSMMVEVRNKLVESYQELMRMQV